MSGFGAPTPASQPRVWHMYRAVVGIGLACGLAIVTVFEFTRPIIRRNKIAMRQRAIFDVLQGARESAAFRLTDAGGFDPASPDDEGTDLVFAGFDDKGALVGLAIEASGMGYQDVVRILYGYSFANQTILGIRVLESRETPGLGDRIETDPDFRRNFGSLDVSLDESGAEIAHPIEFLKSGQKSHPWQIDGITGATITSRAVADMLRESTAWWMPRVWPRRTEFRRHERKE